MDIGTELESLGVLEDLRGGELPVHTPIDGTEIARVTPCRPEDAAAAIDAADAAFPHWRNVPAPRRGELVRLFANMLREHRSALAHLITIETGKIESEAAGEVQEMIDICDFAVGLSRQLHGLTIASERPGHRMMELWHPLGPVGVITAFNFPGAVWSWNFALAIVCGDPVIWKPSEKTPLTALACAALFERTCAAWDDRAPPGLLNVLIGGREAGDRLARARRLKLISATGSARMGREVAPHVAARFARLILELGGNNAGIVMPSADLELAIRSILFSAVGTAGQRCTTMRRLLVHRDLYRPVLDRLKAAYGSLRIGDPRHNETHVGPLIDRVAFEAMRESLETAAADGGTVFGGERVLEAEYPDAWYVRPALVEMPAQTEVVHQETFAPILYVIPVGSLDEAITSHNAVPQGLSSSIFTRDLNESERFLSAAGSDCGIVNVNIGTSGAEIGGAFGGEKETGGGREAGSDVWKSYMRRSTATINGTAALPLAQGVTFEVTVDSA